ncbi:MAG: hypothetical protein ACLQVL_30300 [Terriglobia bacterium]
MADRGLDREVVGLGVMDGIQGWKVRHPSQSEWLDEWDRLTVGHPLV